MTTNTITLDAKTAMAGVTLKIRVPKTLRFRLALAVLLARLTAFVGGMEFEAMGEEAPKAAKP